MDTENESPTLLEQILHYIEAYSLDFWFISMFVQKSNVSPDFWEFLIIYIALLIVSLWITEFQGILTLKRNTEGP